MRAQSGEARGHLRVEHVAHLRVEATADQRDVLAPGVHDDLDCGVGEHLGERRSVELLGQRVNDQDALVRVPGFGDRELHQAQQRAVAALAHELRVQRQAAGRAGAVGQRLQPLVL